MFLIFIIILTIKDVKLKLILCNFLHFHGIYLSKMTFGGLYVKGVVEERAAMLGEYIIESKATVRSAAKKFGISKSTVHKDVSQRLKNVNPNLYKEVREILETNKNQRHIRGGIATRNKYLMLKTKLHKGETPSK